MTTSIRNAVLTALSVLPTVQSYAQIPVRVANTAVLRAKAECADDPSCTCQVLRDNLSGVNSTLFPSDEAAYVDFENEN